MTASDGDALTTSLDQTDRRRVQSLVDVDDGVDGGIAMRRWQTERCERGRRVIAADEGWSFQINSIGKFSAASTVN